MLIETNFSNIHSLNASINRNGPKNFKIFAQNIFRKNRRAGMKLDLKQFSLKQKVRKTVVTSSLTFTYGYPLPMVIALLENKFL